LDGAGAALDVANGQVLAQCKPRHRHQEFLAFLRHLDAAVPAAHDVHLVIDNYATHKHAKVRGWLARRPRFHVHYTPTYASWLNQIERWFGLLSQREIRRGSFTGAKQLIARIDAFVANHNNRAQPFTWTATADEILGKVARIL
jgi:putative transposase